MKIGRLNRRLAYQDPVDGDPDELGQVPETWPTMTTIWAEVRAPTGRELVNADQQQGLVYHTVTIRRAKGWFPKATGRFIYVSATYNTTARVLNVVAAFDPDESNVWVSCLVTEQVEPPPEA